jgi:hypothetical protein
MIPVPGQNLEICSASTCNTRQKERKLDFIKGKLNKLLKQFTLSRLIPATLKNLLKLVVLLEKY